MGQEERKISKLVVLEYVLVLTPLLTAEKYTYTVWIIVHDINCPYRMTQFCSGRYLASRLLVMKLHWNWINTVVLRAKKQSEEIRFIYFCLVMM